jgi:hypothetical protein
VRSEKQDARSKPLTSNILRLTDTVL